MLNPLINIIRGLLSDQENPNELMSNNLVSQYLIKNFSYLLPELDQIRSKQ